MNTPRMNSHSPQTNTSYSSFRIQLLKLILIFTCIGTFYSILIDAQQVSNIQQVGNSHNPNNPRYHANSYVYTSNQLSPFDLLNQPVEGDDNNDNESNSLNTVDPSL